jgi:hypothetical protein
MRVYKRIMSGAPGRNWKLISLVRDPVASNVSRSFQIIDYYQPNFSARDQLGSSGIDETVEAAPEDYDHEKCFILFEVELKPALGLEKLWYL